MLYFQVKHLPLPGLDSRRWKVNASLMMPAKHWDFQLSAPTIVPQKHVPQCWFSTCPAVHRELWLTAARKVFHDLNKDAQDSSTVNDFLDNLRAKLPAAEVEYALEDALVDAGYKGAGQAA